MLHEFLESHRAEILALTEEKTLVLAGPLLSSTLLQQGLPLFLGHLIEYLQSPNTDANHTDIVASAAIHGRELLRLGYTLSHVVHAYGAMCQSITEIAQQRQARISPRDFNDLNMCLDIAIAASVSEFQFQIAQASEEKEIQHLGFLVHELRNALSSATIAHDMITQGLVGTNGSTAKVLEDNLVRMRLLIDRSLSEVRLRADPEVHAETFSLNGLIDQLVITAQAEARTKSQTIRSELRVPIELHTDRQLVLSALANLLQNALKYSKPGGHILLRAAAAAEAVHIDIEDECGGLEDAAQQNLFKPFTSGGFDQTGLGLGLTIVQRAVALLNGTIRVRNRKDVGCVFTVELPKFFAAKPIGKASTGVASAQPHPRGGRT